MKSNLASSKCFYETVCSVVACSIVASSFICLWVVPCSYSPSKCDDSRFLIHGTIWSFVVFTSFSLLPLIPLEWGIGAETAAVLPGQSSAILSFFLATQWTKLMTIYYHLISQAGWNRYILSYLILSVTFYIAGNCWPGVDISRYTSLVSAHVCSAMLCSLTYALL